MYVWVFSSLCFWLFKQEWHVVKATWASRASGWLQHHIISDGTTLYCMYAVRRHWDRWKRQGWQRHRWVCLVNVWLLGGKTQLRWSEGSSSASLWGRSSWAAIRCPESQTHSCSRRHLDTQTINKSTLCWSNDGFWLFQGFCRIHFKFDFWRPF